MTNRPQPVSVQSPFLQFTLACTFMDARLALKRVRAKLERVGIGKKDVDRVEIVLAEVLNNIVEHAHAEEPAQVTIIRSPNKLNIVVLDNGGPMPDGDLPSGQLAEYAIDQDPLPEGGFGWFLIRDLANELEYSRREGKNHLSFVINLNTEAHASCQPAAKSP